MTTEREELRLTVSLVDNVSAGLNKIKGEFKDLTEGGGKQHAEKFKRENTEAIAILKRMTGEAGEAYKAFGMMRLGALGAAGGVALLGYEVAKQAKEWGELAEKVRAANQVARAFGIDPGAMRNIQEQLEAAGVSAEQSQGALTKFLDTMGELQRNPAFRANILQQTLEGNVPAMAARLKQIEEAKTATEKLNLARQLGIDVEQKALARGESPERAAGERHRLEEMLGYNRLALGAAGQLKELTEEQARWEKERNKSLEAYANTLGRIGYQWDEISKLLSGPVFSENSPLVKGAKALESVLTNAKDMLEFIKRGGFDVIMHPLDPEARQRSIDAVKELQHERHERMTPEERAAEHAAEEKAKAAAEATRKQMEDRMEHLRKVAPPQYFSGSGGDDIFAGWPESSNIEDRRGEFDDRAKYMNENTAELKRLNDFLIGGTAAGPGGVGGYGFLSGGAGGGGFASRLGLGPGGLGGINTGATSVAGAAGAGAGAGAAAAGLGDPAAPRNQRGAALYQKLLTEFQKNPPQGLPPDAARFGITKGTPEEWARFGVSVAHAESGFNPQSANTSDAGGSFGVFQYAHNQVPGGNAYDVDASVKAFVRDANQSAGDRRGLRGGILGQRFSTIGRHPERGAAYLRQASELGSGAGAGGGATIPAGEGPSFRTTRNADVEKYVGFDRAVRGLSPEMQARVMSAYRAMPDAVKKSFIINEGWRSYEYQKYLKEGGGHGLVASPGHSRHEGGGVFGAGAAIDVDRGPALDWLHQHGAEHGLGGIGGDYPHIQMTRDGRRFFDPNNPEGIPLPGGAAARGGGGSSPVSRDQIESARSILNRNQSMKVEGSGKLSVDVNAPKGTRVGAQGKGLFKTVEINRQTQMEPAKRGPADAGEE